MQRFTVTTPDRAPARVRRNPSTASETVARLKVGTEVLAGDETNGWRPVTHDGLAGFMPSRFLADEAGKVGEGVHSSAYTLSAEQVTELKGMRDQLADAVRIISEIVG